MKILFCSIKRELVSQRISIDSPKGGSMGREKLVALAREHVEYALEYERSGKNVLADDVFRIPVTN